MAKILRYYLQTYFIIYWHNNARYHKKWVNSYEPKNNNKGLRGYGRNFLNIKTVNRSCRNLALSLFTQGQGQVGGKFSFSINLLELVLDCFPNLSWTCYAFLRKLKTQTRLKKSQQSMATCLWLAPCPCVNRLKNFIRF